MGVSKLVFACAKMKSVDNVQSWENKGCDMTQSIEKTDYLKVKFCLLPSRTYDQSERANVSHSKAQFPAKRNLRST